MLFLSEYPFVSPCKIPSLVIIMCLATGLKAVRAEVASASQEASSLSERGDHSYTTCLAWSSTDQPGFSHPKFSPCTSAVP